MISQPKSIAATAALLALLMTFQVMASPIDLELPAQPLSAALREFARQTGIQIAIQSQLTEGKTAPAVNGRYEPDAALAALLQGTGLMAYVVNQKTYGIRESVPQNVQEHTSLVKPDFHLAQSKNPGEEPQASSPELEEVLVTGTHIRGVAPIGSQLNVYDRKAIDRSGAGSVEEFVRRMPENFSSVSSTSSAVTAGVGGVQSGSNFYAGAAMNLHGLGARSTLTLLDGHRLAPAGLSGEFADISMLPLSAIDRIEVLNDGASAIYGADAVSGVVNFVLRKDFDGAETRARYGDATEGGAGQLGLSQSFGRAWGVGSVMFSYDYDRQDSLAAIDRDFISPTSLAAPALLMPEQHKHSAMLLGHQKFGATELSGAALYGQRSYEGAAGFLSRAQFISGKVKQRGASLVATHGLFGDWLAELGGNYSGVDQYSEVSSAGLAPRPSDTRMDLFEVDVRGNGTVFAMSGGNVRASVGVDFRGDGFKNKPSTTAPTLSLSREAVSAFAEMHLPIISERNSGHWARKLEVSLAGRYDHYNDFGNSTNPKIGVEWSPLAGLGLRASYGTSFRPPLLSELGPQPNYAIFRLSNPGAPVPPGTTVTLVDLSAGNAALNPETAISRSFGLDVKPLFIPELSLSATYFRVDYKDQIAKPPVPVFFIYQSANSAVASPFVTMSPSRAVLDPIFAQGPVADTTGLGEAGVQALFDFRLRNLASTRESGINLTLNYGVNAVGRWDFLFSGDKLLDMRRQATSLTPVIDVAGTVYNPTDLRLSGGFAYSHGRFGVGLTADYWDSYLNTLFTPAAPIASWTTLDLQLTWNAAEKGSGLLRGMNASLTVQNVADSNPPNVRAPSGNNDPGFDPTNASPLGRVVALQLRRRW